MTSQSFFSDTTVIVNSPQLELPDYTVPEDIGTFLVCLSMTPNMPFDKAFDIIATTADAAAGMYLLRLCMSLLFVLFIVRISQYL